MSNDGSVSTPGSGSLLAPFVASVDDDSQVIAPVAISRLEIRCSVHVASKARSVQPTVWVPCIASQSKGGKRYPGYVYEEVSSSADASNGQPGPYPPAVPSVHVTGSRAFTTTQVDSEVVGTSLGGWHFLGRSQALCLSSCTWYPLSQTSSCSSGICC